MITLKTLPPIQESLTYQLIKPSDDHHLKVTVKITHYDTYEFHNLYFLRGSYSSDSVKQRIAEEEYYASESAQYRVRYTVMGFNYLPIFDPASPLPKLKDGEAYRVEAFYRDDLTDSLLYTFAYMSPQTRTVSAMEEYFLRRLGEDIEIFNICAVPSPYANNDGNF